MTGVPEILQLSQDILFLNFIVFLRVGPVIALFPGFGEETVPLRIKLALALAFTVIVAPAVGPDLAETVQNPPHILRLILPETAIGLLMGIGVRLFLLALQTAGSIAAQSTSLSQILGGASITPLPAMGHVLVTGAVALAMILDLHVRVAEMAVLSYGVFPVARLPEAAILSQWGIRQIANAFAFAFTLSAPFVLVSVLYNLTLGIINRAMPQLMVVFVGAPAIAAAGLFMLMLLAPMMLTVWIEALQAFITNPFGAQ
ncbi:flagellar biosynthetic protein FliR [Roseovarius lutimaris]|uniref:Flagellar biosynthetic protein FliR n=1 Tax=Roseovarius lutimaris TaxID=1005928 RepID=A0A1I5EV89_9RHOB|nr:flagellar biosynthetic protein FliR [Roseovarius lutimaris]SFO14961.1 flagellar biosynthetic protein FliR [Roseovarius lutimaris]